MFTNPYEEKLAQLKDGTLEELAISREDLLLFREAWLKLEDRADFVGEARHGGQIIYRYEKKE